MQNEEAQTIELPNLIVIAFINRKGGAYKTTSAAYITTCLVKAGYKVKCYDADPEKTWSKWAKIPEFPYKVEETHYKHLKQQINQLKGKFKGYVIIDTPPNDAEAAETTANIADEIIVPLAPTGLDVNRLPSTLETISKVEKEREKALTSILLSNWVGSKRISKETVADFEKKGLPLLDQRIRQLTCYEKFVVPKYLEEYGLMLVELEILKLEELIKHKILEPETLKKMREQGILESETGV